MNMPTSTPRLSRVQRFESLLERAFAGRVGLLVLYVIFAAIYLAAAGPRLRRHSEDNHFVYLADGWLHGRWHLDGQPPHENDWGKLDVLTLRDGRVLKGMFRQDSARFMRAEGGSVSVSDDQIVRRDTIRFVSFPPLPAVLMLPFVAIWKLGFNDVVFTALWAALNPMLLFVTLRRLVSRGHSRRTVPEDLQLTALLGVGSVYFYSSVVGQVWYTAHIVAVTFAIAYAWASIDAARPALAGLAMGLGFAARVPCAFMWPFFVWEAVRVSGGLRVLWAQKKLPRALVVSLVKFAAPAAAVVVVVMLHNYLRFGNFTELGHKFLNISWQPRMQRWGEVNYHFLSRNLAAALVLMPRILTTYPFVKVSVHGMSLLITSPNLAWLVRPKVASPLAPGLWLTALAMSMMGLLYHNSGFIQFGYRFSNDYFIFFVLLLAVGGVRFGKLWKLALVFAIGVNLFGAIVYDRQAVFTYSDGFFPHGND